jgi:polyhydroxyalkanoate synthesis regulator phasin
MEEKTRKAFLAAVGVIFKTGKVVHLATNKVEQMVNSLIREGEMNEVQAREFVTDTMFAVEKKAQELQASVEKKTQSVRDAVMREINRMAKKVAKATKPVKPKH